MNAFKNLPFAGQLAVTVVLMAIIVGTQYKWPPLKLQAKATQNASKRTRLDSLIAEVQKGINLEKKLPELEHEIANLEGQLSVLKQIIPPVRNDAELVSKFQSLASRSRVNILKISPQRLRKKDFYDEYPLALDVLANYHDLAKFFDRMAHLPRIFNVSGVSIKQSTGKGKGARADATQFTVRASFTAVTFIYREDSGLPAPPKPMKKKRPVSSDEDKL